jgi:hypothetical protein
VSAFNVFLFPLFYALTAFLFAIAIAWITCLALIAFDAVNKATWLQPKALSLCSFMH